ncbi:ABC transporter ATP-binding protein [Actinoplanes sp. HUAS TT8]|uniref:ABC transporter ATP-binding protein n=1 Tax=Actinoplanes sp. HUAS TT8 TaxID=3447453 RepID=UPI003F51C312
MRRLPEADPGQPDVRSPVRFLLWNVRQSCRSQLLAATLAVLWMCAQALTPAVFGWAIDALIAGGSSSFFGVVGLLFCVGIAQTAAGIARHRFSVVNWLGAAFRTVQLMVRQVTKLGSNLPSRLETGEVIALGAVDLTNFGGATDAGIRGLGALSAICIVATVLLTTSIRLGLVVLIGVPLLMLIAGLLIRTLHRRQQMYRERRSALTGRAADLIAGQRTLQGVGGEDVMAARYRADSRALERQGIRIAEMESLVEAVQVLLPGILLVLILWSGARLAMTGVITIGQLVSFYAYAAFLATPLRQLTDVFSRVSRGVVAARRVTGMLEQVPDVADSPRPRPVPVSGDLVDPESGVVITPGCVIALVAPDPHSVVRIADRLGGYRGGAEWNGVPLVDLPQTDLRKRILVVDNDALLFSGSLRADLNPHRSDRAMEAIEAAAMTDVIEGLPDGLDTEVAERGRSLSGGQQQRLRLARALVANPEILILIEPTNAVDTFTEALIAVRLRDFRAGRTTVICTSSPFVLNRVDHVQYVVAGEVLATGSHSELLLSEPGYARLVLDEESS